MEKEKIERDLEVLLEETYQLRFRRALKYVIQELKEDLKKEEYGKAI